MKKWNAWKTSLIFTLSLTLICHKTRYTVIFTCICILIESHDFSIWHSHCNSERYYLLLSFKCIMRGLDTIYIFYMYISHPQQINFIPPSCRLSISVIIISILIVRDAAWMITFAISKDENIFSQVYVVNTNHYSWLVSSEGEAILWIQKCGERKG